DPAVKDLYHSLSVPYDVVTLQGGTPIVAEPIPAYIGSRPRFKNTLEVKSLNDKWEPAKPYSLTRGQITGVDPFEHIAVKKVDEFLGKTADQPRMDMLQHAERVLE